METKIKDTSNLYTALAHLMYAVAKADKKFEPKEKIKIKNLVEEHVLFSTLEEGNKEKIYAVLRSLILENATSEKALGVFSEFYKENQDLFTEELKKNIMEVAAEIATSFAKRNKSELVLLSRLHILFWKSH